jgi:hypothetical protein
VNGAIDRDAETRARLREHWEAYERGDVDVEHPGYYGAFVLDPDGHNVEVVNHNR